MTDTTTGGLPLMAQTQPQRYLSYNELAWALNVLQAGVISRTETTPPGSPAEGDAYIVDATATGAWVGLEDKIVFWFGGVWNVLEPEIAQGRGLYVQDEQTNVRWDPLGSPPAYVVAAAGNVNGPVSSVANRIAVFADISGKILSDGGKSISDISTQVIPIAVSDETTDLTTGTAKVTFRMPYAFTLTAVRASVTTAPTGAAIVVDINEGDSPATILSTKITIDATEKTSTTAAAPVISDASLADDAQITIDIDQIGSTIAGAGLKVYLIGTKT